MDKSPKKWLAHLQQGFTLVELIVAMALAGIVMGAIYSTYKSQQDSYTTQTHVVEMQQNLRAALYMIGRDIRMAGYNPAGIPDLAGFTQSLLDGDGNEATDSTRMAFTIDDDTSGAINTDDSDEQIAYRLSGSTLEKYTYDAVDGWDWRTVAENIDALDFVYLDGSGSSLDPATAENLPLIRSVQISLVAKTAQIDKDFPGTPAYYNQQGTEILAAKSDNYRRRLLTTEIRCRNMGI